MLEGLGVFEGVEGADEVGVACDVDWLEVFEAIVGFAGIDVAEGGLELLDMVETLEGLVLIGGLTTGTGVLEGVEGTVLVGGEFTEVEGV